MLRAAAGRNRTNRCLQLLCAAAAFLLLLSCSGRPTVLFFLEEHWEEFFRGSLQELPELIKSLGFRQEIVRTGGDYDGFDWGSLEASLEDDRPAIAVLSPFMKPIAAELASRNPRITFLLLAETAKMPGTDPANLVSVTFDRVPVFREAGEAIGKIVQGLQERQAPDRKTAQKVGVIYTREGLHADAEIEAFREGFARKADESLLFIRRLDDDSDAIKARATMEEAKNQDALFYLLHLQKLLPSCMDFLSGGDGWAIIADWERSYAFRDNVVMSVEEDYLDAIERALRITVQGDQTVQTIAGTVYLSVNPRYLEGGSASGEDGQGREGDG